MTVENTLSIIKPDAFRKGHVEEICKRLEAKGLTIKEKKEMHLSDEEAEGFYIEHKERPFFPAPNSSLGWGSSDGTHCFSSTLWLKYRNMVLSRNGGPYGSIYPL